MRKLRIRYSLAPLLALSAAAWTGRLAWARHQGGPVETLLLRAEADPDHETRYWRQALALRPRTWEAMVGLALNAESGGATVEARRLFDQAANVNRTFRPVWARLNHLARTGDETAFWPAARDAFAMSHRDRQALFELCWRMRPAGAFLIREVTGTRPPVLFDATRFLFGKDLPAARLAYARLIEQPYLPLAVANAGRVATPAERRDLGLDLCDLDLDLGHREEAWTTWKAMQRHRLLERASGRGFDWRPGPLGTGVEATGVEATAAGSQWVVTLSGQTSEQPLLWRPAPPVEERDGIALPAGGRSWREGQRIHFGTERGFRGTIQVRQTGASAE